MTISEKVQEFDPGERVELFELDATSFGQGILRFTASGVDGVPGAYTKISFDGNLYDPLPIQATGFVWSGKGTQPKPKLVLSSINPIVRALLFNNDGLVGIRVTRRVTFSDFLDGHAEADGTQVLSEDIFNVERMTSMNKIFSSLELSTILDIEGAVFPSGQLIRNTCINIYRYWDGSAFVYDTGRACPYVGVATFDINNAPSTDEGDVCDHHLTGCRKRFGETGPLSYLGFPGLLQV
jgi:lambda family phage minor tail protein L